MGDRTVHHRTQSTSAATWPRGHEAVMIARVFVLVGMRWYTEGVKVRGWNGCLYNAVASQVFKPAQPSRTPWSPVWYSTDQRGAATPYDSQHARGSDSAM
jgi:hypothetical protein